MQIKNTRERFGIIAISLHWIIAALIITLIACGLYMTRIPLSLWKLQLHGWHKEFGFLVLMLAVIRIAWRLQNINPSLDSLPWWERLPARAMHWAFYGFMFLMPISGWLITSASDLPVSFFGLFVIPILPVNKEYHWLYHDIHTWGSYILIAAIIGHIGAALKHHFINKDNILRRML